MVASKVLRSQFVRSSVLLLSLNALLHLVLDSIVGCIYWLAPFPYECVQLVSVPSGHDWWVWNFVFHWTFIFELLILVVFGVVVRQALSQRSLVADQKKSRFRADSRHH